MIKIKIKGARGSGKTTIASIIEDALNEYGFDVDVEDGDGSYVSCNTMNQIKSIAKNHKIAIKVINKGD